MAELFCHVHFQSVKCCSLDFFGSQNMFFIMFFCYHQVFFLFSNCVFPVAKSWPAVAGDCFPCGSVESSAWQRFVSDVAVWCLVRGRGSLLTWQCGVLCVAGVPF